MNWNHRVSRGSQVAGGRSQLSAFNSQVTGDRSQVSGVRVSGPTRLWRNPGLAALFLAVIVLSAAALFHSVAPAHAAKAAHASNSTPNLSSISVPMFFEPNQGQTDPRVKFLARGSGYGLFLTSDEAVLEVQGRPSVLSRELSGPGSQIAVRSAQLATRGSKPEAPVTSIIRMHLEGANPDAKISGSDLLPGKSNYFIGNDPARWRRNIPQFARVNYRAVYPGVDLVYYGNQGHLEYDFHVGPGADPKQIALKFEGASTRLENGDLVLSTRAGDVRFHAPSLYQQDGDKRQVIEGGFRQLADDKVGFQIGAYDHGRELVIDPTLFYSSWLGGGGESNVHVAVDAGGFNVYVAGSTTSATFPTVNPISCPPDDCSKLNGTENIFISKINPSGTGLGQLEFSTYLGGNGTDIAAGVAVDNGASIYVAGSTTSTDFPTTANAFQTAATENPNAQHGFMAKLSLSGLNYSLAYSTYLSGSGVDTVTGMTIDQSNDAFVTGITTSTDGPANGFPATANGFQTASNGADTQFFASKMNTGLSGSGSMVYSTYFGGGFPTAPTIQGGGIALDSSGNMYFTGGSNFWGITGPQGQTPFPLLNAQQTCLNEAGINGTTKQCNNPPTSFTDAFAAKINPNIVGTGGLQYSTFLGGSDNDFGLAIAVDSSSNAYVTGETFSGDWNAPTALTPFQPGNGGSGDAFIAKLGPATSKPVVFPLVYFTYLGGGGTDIGNAIVVDSVFAAHVAGVTVDGFTQFDGLPGQSCNGSPGDAFVALISSTSSGQPAGDYFTCLGGTDFDEGTGIALDSFNATYVAGDTKSGDFPPKNPLQGFVGSQDAFVSKLTSISNFAYAANSPSVSPNPADMGAQATFTFEWVNNGPDAANNVSFTGLITTGLVPGPGYTFVSATTSPGSTCPAPVNNTLLCNIGTVAVNADVTVTVVLTPVCNGTQCPTSLQVSPSLTANGVTQAFNPVPVAVNDYSISANPPSQTVTAGGPTSYTVTLTSCSWQGSTCVPGNGATYPNSISLSAVVAPTTSTITATFNPASVTISGSGSASSTLNIATQPRPVTGGSLWHRGAVYATWLPVGGLSLLGLGVSASRRRRRWIAGGLLGLIAGIVLLQGACGSSSSSNTTPTGGTPAGTYTLRITGTSGSASHLTQVTLVVN